MGSNLAGRRKSSYFGAGIFAPFFRASDSPMAIACFRLVTFPPVPPFPERSVPRFFRFIALSTLLLALLPYLRRLFLSAIGFLPGRLAFDGCEVSSRLKWNAGTLHTALFLRRNGNDGTGIGPRRGQDLRAGFVAASLARHFVLEVAAIAPSGTGM